MMLRRRVRRGERKWMRVGVRVGELEEEDIVERRAGSEVKRRVGSEVESLQIYSMRIKWLGT